MPTGIYKRNFSEKTSTWRKNYKKEFQCLNCEKLFVVNGLYAKFCSECKPIIRKIYQDQYAKEHKVRALELIHKFRSTSEGMEKQREWNRKWKKNNPDKVRFSKCICQRRRQQRMVGTFKFSEWEKIKKDYNYTCLMCKKSEPEIKLTIDHIIPLSMGGLNIATNIQPLCGRCNSVKSNKLAKSKTFRAMYVEL